MNSKGQIAVYGFMLALVAIILALALAFPMKQTTDAIRNETYNEGVSDGLNCSSATVTDYVKSACYITDITPVIFVGILIAIAGIIIAARIVFA